jgi:hypothetical protein
MTTMKPELGNDDMLPKGYDPWPQIDLDDQLRRDEQRRVDSMTPAVNEPNLRRED